MARQTLSLKNVEKIKNKTGLPVYSVLVRGGTDHRKDLCLEDGSVYHLHKNGSLEKSIFSCNAKGAQSNATTKRE